MKKDSARASNPQLKKEHETAGLGLSK